MTENMTTQEETAPEGTAAELTPEQEDVLEALRDVVDPALT
jgi:metal-sulfur cluster biosynthetic enzyme